MAKRKHASVTAEPVIQTPSVSNLKDLYCFNAVSKPNKEVIGLKKQKTIHERLPTPPPTAEPTPPAPRASNKRKRDLNAVEEEPVRVELIKPAGPSIFARFARPQIITFPRNKRGRNTLPPSPTECASPAKLFGKLNLDEELPSETSQAQPQQQQHGLDTPPDTPEADVSEMQSQWPTELQDFTRLHAAFLSALTMYYSHNGTSSPVEVSALLPSITSSYKKRSVTLDDLRRVLAVVRKQDRSFVLEDFGRAGICLRKESSNGQPSDRASSYIDENEMNVTFEDALQREWQSWQAGFYAGDAITFVEQLPLVEIGQNTSVERAAPLFERGKQRLADIKASQAAAHAQQSQWPKPATADETIAQAVGGRGTSLLDRLLAKQTRLASLPAGPTREQLDRKSALQRVEDIARVLELLAAGRPRATFSLASMTSHLQQSLRNPITKDEVARCLGLMSSEVCPGFVQLIMSGIVMGVVVTKAGKLSVAEIKARLAELGA